MKWPSAILIVLSLAVVFSPAMALNVGLKPDCSDLLDKLGNCNQQPDAARLACQKAVCTFYNACLDGSEPITAIPVLAKLCTSPAVPVTSPLAAEPIR